MILYFAFIGSSTMQKGLVVIQAEEKIRRLMTVASEIAIGTNAELVLYQVSRPTDEDRKEMADITGRENRYRSGTEGGRAFTEDLASELLDEAIEYEVHSAIGQPAERILQAIKSYECDHLFMTGRQRSPTGKAVFGDSTQNVLLETSVPVTLVMQ